MTSSDTLQHYARHDALTHPAGFAPLYDALPEGASALCSVMSGLIVHTSWADKYGIPSGAPLPRETKPVADRLAEIQQRLAGPLVAERAPFRRPFGTCRDFALLLCSAMRHRRVPARVRCGFATYFANRRYEDHWICEYWIESEGRWAMADAQLDALQRDQLAITFDTADMPVDAFLPAIAAWEQVRCGAVTAEEFGHGDTRGLWFLSVNLHRDVLAVANRHTSEWDGWRGADPDSRHVSDNDFAVCDRLSAAAAAAVQSGSVRILEELAKSHLTPRWQRGPEASQRVTVAR